MSFINYMAREINCKIVYYGPGLCGKTTNLQYIYNKTNPEAKGKMISLATETERTLFFDFLPLSLGEIRGFKTRFHLYTVPGQVFYDASRKLILKGVDGVVYVGDSQMERMEANIESLENLRSTCVAELDIPRHHPIRDLAPELQREPGAFGECRCAVGAVRQLGHRRADQCQPATDRQRPLRFRQARRVDEQRGSHGDPADRRRHVTGEETAALAADQYACSDGECGDGVHDHHG